MIDVIGNHIIIPQSQEGRLGILKLLKSSEESVVCMHIWGIKLI